MDLSNIPVWVDGHIALAGDVRRAYQKAHRDTVQMRLEENESGDRWISFRTISWSMNHDVLNETDDMPETIRKNGGVR